MTVVVTGVGDDRDRYVDGEPPRPTPAPFRVRVEDLRLPPNVVAGCNVLVVASLAYMLRATTEDPPPVEVTVEPDGSWRIRDGRHRYLAAVIAGRADVLCVRVVR